MQTNPTSSSGAGSNANANAAAAPNGASVTSDMFTKLLVAQIQNQDPTAPTDPSTFVNQLATLSQTESLQSMTDATSANASILQSLQVLAMGAQVGSTLTATSSTVTLADTPVNGSVTFVNGTSKANLVLTGSDGQKHNVALGPQNAGTVPFTLDPSALGLAPGTYSMAVEDDASDSPPVQITGTLSSVQLSTAGSVTLVVSNLGNVAPSAVTGFSGAASSTPH
jgi:flagellar basal-body rod modification protein FlgD